MAVGWLAWRMTESVAWLGIIAFAELFPSLVLGPIGGSIADRYEPRRVAIVTQSLAMLQATALCLLSAANMIDIWSLLVITVLRGGIVAIDQPSRFSIVACLAPRADLPSVVATNSVLFNSARFIGPALAGAIIVHGGISLAFGVNAIGYFAYLYALCRLSVEPTPVNVGPRPGLIAQSVDGYRYALGHPGIRALLILFFAATALVHPVTEFLPGIAERLFSADVSGLAGMTSAIGFGAITGGLLMMRGLKMNALLALALAGVAIAALSLAAFTFMSSFAAALCLLALCGLAIAVNGISTQTLLQEAVDDRLRGRVMGLYAMIFRGGPAIGSLIIGVTAEHFGLRASFAGSAGICLLFVVWATSQKREIFQSLRFGPAKAVVLPERPA